MSNYSFSTHANSRGNKFYRNAGPVGRARVPKRRGAYINPQKFIHKAALPQEQVVFTPTHSFADFALSEAVKRSVVRRGYTTPTPIQDKTIPNILDGRDLIGLANTGTGKTAAFLLPIIHKLHAAGGRGLALIIAPTRELAVQIDEEFKAFAAGLQLYSALCVGGTNLYRQIKNLNRRPQVVIGTPGRLRDLATQGPLKLDTVSILVLDEADRMLDMGFSRDIHYLVDLLPKSRQSLCFSATMNPDMERLVRELLNDPITVSVKTGETSNTVEQNVISANSKEHKMELLLDLLRKPEFEKVLIFGETKRGVQRLAESLANQGHAAEAIHGNKSQPQRQRALQAFKNNVSKVLVATDVAARGLDIPHVTHVINFDQPYTYEDYIHRIGRTGRAGMGGQALTFVSPD